MSSAETACPPAATEASSPTKAQLDNPDQAKPAPEAASITNGNQSKARNVKEVRQSPEVPHAIEIEKTQTRDFAAVPRHLAKTETNPKIGASPIHLHDHVLPVWKPI